MLFNSFSFLFVFLPVTWILFTILSASMGLRVSMLWLGLASIFFYGWWNPLYVPILLLSVAVNFGLAWLALKAGERATSRSVFITLGILFNLVLLGYFKYVAFFGSVLNGTFNAHIFSTTPHELPLGISFFTFLQIAFLVDVGRGDCGGYNLQDYGLFVTFFPHLIAGPLVRHDQLIPQFSNPEKDRKRNFSIGLVFLSIGLAKKVLLADALAPQAQSAFQMAQSGVTLGLWEAWQGILAYTLQLYFDFSGYSDMAIGIGYFFGLVLPINFDSPFKSGNVVEFWRRWHITLGIWLRHYLFTPLSFLFLRGGLQTTFSVGIALVLTMFLGGMWHGAGWTFMIWGLLHAAYLVTNYVWSKSKWRSRIIKRESSFYRAICVGVTFVAVMAAFVFFRADNLVAAVRFLKAMLGLNGFQPGNSLASFYVKAWPALLRRNFTDFSGGEIILALEQTATLFLGLGIVFLLPNIGEITYEKRKFNPVILGGLAGGLFFIVAKVMATAPASPFLYFKF